MAIKTLRKVKGKPVSRVELGRMYFFKYLPEEPDNIHDIYPLVFVLKRRGNLFDAINYHHLSIKSRILLYNNMIPYFTDTPLEEDSQLKWKTFRRQIFSKKKLRGAEISFRQYKLRSVRSKIIEIEPQDWERTLLISSEQFRNELKRKVTSAPVWKQNDRLIRSNK
tara:strand:+ start:4187 stop:4684 length:498 start_codon:yes stop_codon:yes gene_type:complete